MTGLGTYTRELIRALTPLAASRSIELMMFALPEFAAQLRESDSGADIRTVVYPVENHIQGEWWKHVRLPGILEACGVDVFHDPAYQVPLRSSATRYVTTIHDFSPFRFPESNTWKYNSYWKWMTHRAIKRSARIITVSKHVRDELETLFPECCDRVDVVYEAASPIFSPGDFQTDVVQRLQLKRPYFLTTAKYEPRKNLARCLQAFRQFKRGEPGETMFVVAGAMGWKTGRIERTVVDMTERGEVCFAGYLAQDELVDLIRGAHAVLVPSLYEGFGLPVLEAMACGTPVACSNRGALKEVGGRAALYFDPLDCESMAGAMRRLVNDASLQVLMRQRGIQQAKLFSWQRSAEATLNVYERALDGS